VVRSRWLAVCLALYTVLAGVFIAAGLRESGVIGFTGLGRVLFSLCHTLVLLLPLVALVATGQVVNRARDEGTLELFLSQPIRRSAYLARRDARAPGRAAPAARRRDARARGGGRDRTRRRSTGRSSAARSWSAPRFSAYVAWASPPPCWSGTPRAR
jgi:hypothetical protein